MIKKMNIAGLLLAFITLTGIYKVQAAEYLKLSPNEAATIQIDKLAVIDQLGNRFFNNLQIKAADTQALHVGQKYNEMNLTSTSPGIEDGAFTIVDKTLVIPQLIQDQQHTYNVTLMLTNADTPELTVTGLGIVGQQGPKGDTGLQGTAGSQGATGLRGPTGPKGDTGPQGPIGLTGAKGDKGDQGLTGLKGDTGPAGTYAAGSGISIDNNVISTATQTHAIGESYGGGIVFDVNSTGTHGLIAANKDQSTTVTWYNAQNVISRAINYDTAGQAYRDWRLPTISELQLMNNNIGSNAPAPLTNVGGFDSKNTYWSSTELDANFAKSHVFSSGLNEGAIPKTNSMFVRAVRAF